MRRQLLAHGSEPVHLLTLALQHWVPRPHLAFDLLEGHLKAQFLLRLRDHLWTKCSASGSLCPTLPTHTFTPTVPVRGITTTSHSRSPKKRHEHSDETTRQCHRLNTEQRTSDTTHQPTNTTATSFETISARGDRGEHRVPIQAPDPVHLFGRSLSSQCPCHEYQRHQIATATHFGPRSELMQSRQPAKHSAASNCSHCVSHSKHVQGTRFPEPSLSCHRFDLPHPKNTYSNKDWISASEQCSWCVDCTLLWARAQSQSPVTHTKNQNSGVRPEVSWFSCFFSPLSHKGLSLSLSRYWFWQLPQTFEPCPCICLQRLYVGSAEAERWVSLRTCLRLEAGVIIMPLLRGVLRSPWMCLFYQATLASYHHK